MERKRGENLKINNRALIHTSELFFTSDTVSNESRLFYNSQVGFFATRITSINGTFVTAPYLSTCTSFVLVSSSPIRPTTGSELF